MKQIKSYYSADKKQRKKVATTVKYNHIKVKLLKSTFKIN